MFSSRSGCLRWWCLDRGVYILLWPASLATGCIPTVFLVGSSPSSPTRLKQVGSFAAIRVCLDHAFAFRGIRCSRGSGWCLANHSRSDAPGCSGVQQHPVQFDVAGHEHRFGSASPAFSVAKSLGDWSRRSPVSSEEWPAHFYDCDAWDSSRSWIPHGKTASPGRDCFLCDRSDCRLRVALDTPERRRIVHQFWSEPGESQGDSRLMVKLPHRSAACPARCWLFSQKDRHSPEIYSDRCS